MRILLLTRRWVWRAAAATLIHRQGGPERDDNKPLTSSNSAKKWYHTLGFASVSCQGVGPRQLTSDPAGNDVENTTNDNTQGKSGVNIVVLGEAGVGKSTWINSLVNYSKFSTFTDALQGEVVHVIDEENENKDAAKSKTLSPYTYEFHWNDQVIRIIDTPGINDTAGKFQDQLNIEKIFVGLSHFQELHTICILVKSTDNRLNENFKMLIDELLKNFHENARKNIVFCYTHVSEFDDVACKEVLEKYFGDERIDIHLNEDNQFHFNNMGYKHLIQRKSSGEGSDLIYDHFWKKSAEETERLLNHATRMPPHSIQDTNSINRANNLIKNLIRPLCEANENISEYLNSNTGSFKISPVRYPVPKIVCTKCTQIKEINIMENGIPLVCPVNNQCMDLMFDIFFARMVYVFWRYSIISLLRCPNCHCWASEHDVSCYETRKTGEKIQISKPTMEKERRVILEACAKFSRFSQLHNLAGKNNTPEEKFKNDVFMKKFAETISRYKAKESSQKHVQALKEMRNTYISIAKDCQNVDVSLKDIDDLVDSLYKLSVSGKMIQKSVEIQEEFNKKMALRSPLGIFQLFFKKDK